MVDHDVGWPATGKMKSAIRFAIGLGLLVVLCASALGQDPGWSRKLSKDTGTTLIYQQMATVEGPYGSAKRGAFYNPYTGTYRRGASASTP